MKRLAGTILLSVLTAGCGGGGDDAIAPVPDAAVGGIWRGTESSTGLDVLGLIDEDGNLHFIREDGAQYVGTASSDGNDISADFEGYAPVGTTFEDGSTHGTGSLQGTLSARSSVTSDFSFTTDADTQVAGTLNLSFDSLYNRDSSLVTISGNYSNLFDGSVVTVHSDGTIFSQSQSSDCVLNGTVALVDGSYNAYQIEYSYDSCTGQEAVLNGVEFSGLGTLDNTVSPEQAIIGVTAQRGNEKVAVVLTLERT